MNFEVQEDGGLNPRMRPTVNFRSVLYSFGPAEVRMSTPGFPPCRTLDILRLIFEPVTLQSGPQNKTPSGCPSGACPAPGASRSRHPRGFVKPLWPGDTLWISITASTPLSRSCESARRR